jgi:hypothetical protein
MSAALGLHLADLAMSIIAIIASERRSRPEIFADRVADLSSGH